MPGHIRGRASELPGPSDFIPFLVEERRENKASAAVCAVLLFPASTFAFDPARRRTRSRPQTDPQQQTDLPSFFFFFKYIFVSLPSQRPPPLPPVSLSPQHRRPDFQWSLDRLASIIQAFFFFLYGGPYLYPQRLEPLPRTDQPPALQALRRMKNFFCLFIFLRHPPSPPPRPLQ